MQQHSTVVQDRFGCPIGVSWWMVFHILDGRETRSSVVSDNALKSCIQTAGDENHQLTAGCQCARCEIDILARAIERSASRDTGKSPSHQRNKRVTATVTVTRAVSRAISGSTATPGPLLTSSENQTPPNQPYEGRATTSKEIQYIPSCSNHIPIHSYSEVGGLRKARHVAGVGFSLRVRSEVAHLSSFCPLRGH